MSHQTKIKHMREMNSLKKIGQEMNSFQVKILKN